MTSDRPDLPLQYLDCALEVARNGSYELRVEAADSNGDRLVAAAGAAAQTSPEGLALRFVTGNGKPAATRTLSVDELLALLGHGYRFDGQADHRQPGVVPRVAFTVIDSAAPGGGPAMVYRYANWLVALGVRVTIYSDDEVPSWTPVSAEVRCIRDRAERYAAIDEPVVIAYSLLELPLLLRHMAGTGQRVLHLCQGLESCHYGTDYGSLMARKPLFSLLEALPVERLVVSPHLQGHFGGDAGKDCRLIPNGIDERLFVSRAPRELRREDLRVLCVGDPTHLLKGVGTLMVALGQCAERHPDWRIRLVIVSGKDVALEEIERHARGYAVSVQCRQTPRQMRHLYHGADLFVNASWYEGFGLPSLEAMACGVPVVQADNRGIEGIARHQENCFLVPPDNPLRLAEGIEALVADSGLRGRLVAGGLTTAAGWTVRRQFARFVEAFGEILGEDFDRARVAAIDQELAKPGEDMVLEEAEARSAPLFSVLVPSYNQAHFLPEALDSLLAQTYPHWEALVVNDGSTDDTAQVAAGYAARDPRIRVFNKANGGVGSALNEGLRQARGSWICWLSTDDKFLPDKLQLHAAACREQPEAQFFHTDYLVLLEEQQQTVASGRSTGSIPPRPLQLLNLFQCNYFNGISVAIRRTLFEQFGEFSERLRYGQDFEMWLRIQSRHPAHYIDRPTCVTRVHPGQDTQQFMEAGFIDSGVACLGFLNGHRFPDLFPWSDLGDPEQADMAVRYVLSVVLDRNSYMSYCGFSLALIERLREWLGAAPPALRNRLQPVIGRCADQAAGGELPPDLGAALLSLPRQLATAFRYRPREPLAELRRHLGWLRQRGDALRVAAFEKYFAHRQRVDGASSGQAERAAEGAGGDGLRILVVAHNFVPHHYGGVEVYSFNMARRLRRLGHQVEVFYPLPEFGADLVSVSSEELEGLRLWKLRLPAENSIQAQLHQAAVEQQFAKLLEAGQYDVIHFQHTLNLPFGLVEIAARSGAAVVYTCHDFWAICPRVTLYRSESRELCPGPESMQGCARCLATMLGRSEDAEFGRGLRTALAARSDYLRGLWRSVDLLTAPSAYVADKLRRHGVDADIRVLPLGIEPVTPRRRPGSPGLTIGFIGNIHPLKNADLLATAFQQVRGEARLLFFGGGLAEDIGRLEAMARADRRIEYRGKFLPGQLAEILGQLDLLVVPSATESFGLVAREALSAGVPVAAARVGGVAEAVREGENGYLFEPGDVAALGRLLQGLVDRPETVRGLAVDRSALLTIDADAQDWSSRYRDLVAGKRRPDAPPAAAEAAGLPIAGGYDYLLWCNGRRLSQAEARLYEQRIASWGTARPRFHLAVPLAPGEENLLVQTIQSLTQQYYYDVVLTVVSRSPAPPGFAGERLRWRQEGGEPLAALGAALAELPADWVGLLRPGDQVALHAFLFLAEAAYSHPGWQAIYTDHDEVDGDGMRGRPCFLPDFNRDLLFSQGGPGGLLLARQEFFTRGGGFDLGAGEAAELDLLLRAYEAAGGDAIGHVADVLLSRPRRQADPAATLQLRARCVAEHLRRSGQQAKIFPGLAPDSLHVVRESPGTSPVSILVVPEGGVVALQQCLESVIGNTAYGDFEILLACPAAADEAVRGYLDGIRSLGEPRLRVIDTAAGSRGAVLDALAREAAGSHLLLLGDRLRAVQQDWLAEMMSHGRRPEVGIVGARLLAADGTVRGGALLLGVGGAARPAFAGLPADQPGYLGRAQAEQEYSAVCGDCLLVGKALYERLGGWSTDPDLEPLADVEFCLRATAAGRRVVWTPFATLLETVPPEPPAEAVARAADRLYRRWLPTLALDPAYNRNLSLAGPGFEIHRDRLATWDPLSWRPLPRVLVQPADREGSGEYRILAPMRALFEAGRAECRDSVAGYSPVEMARIDPDAIVVQRQIRDDLLEALERHKAYARAFRVYEIDDLITQVPRQSGHRDSFGPDTLKRLRRAVALCDRLVVSTAPLADAYRSLAADIRVVPNYLERARWEGLAPARRGGRRLRVGWAGGSSHLGDLRVVADVVRELAREVDWIFLGGMPEDFRKYAAEYHAPVAFEHYPRKLASLGLDLAIAPLEQNAFNEAKSNLRLLEYGILGYPVVCTDIEPYRCGLPVTRVKNRHKDWVGAIRAHLRDPAALARAGDALREQIRRDWMLEDHLDAWRAAWLP